MALGQVPMAGPGFGPPPGTAGPAPAYASPPPGYNSPPPGYANPPPGYAVPQPVYASPQPGFTGPPPGFTGPPPRMAGPAQPRPPAEEQVVEVRVEGNRTVTREKILAGIHTRAGRPYNPEQIEKDVRGAEQNGVVRHRPAIVETGARRPAGNLPGRRAAAAPGGEDRRQPERQHQDAEEGGRAQGGRRGRPLQRRERPPQDRGILPEERLQQGPRNDPRGQQGGRPAGHLRHRRGPATEGPLDQLRRQHDLQRPAPAAADQDQPPLVLSHQGRGGPQADRRRQGAPDGLLPRAGVLPDQGRRAIWNSTKSRTGSA